MLTNRLFNLFGRQLQRSMSHTRFARLMLVSIMTLFAVLSPQAVFANQTVDPSTLNPPPPPEFNPVCQAVGDGTICTVSFTQMEGPDGTGIICGSGPNTFEVVGSDTRTVTGHRYYDRDGNLTQRHFREVFVGTLTNPLTGAFLDFVQADTIIHNLAVPGDVNTGTFSSSGGTRVFMPNGAVVLIDAGRALIVESDGTILFEAGQHPFDAYYVFGDTSALQPICDALS